MKKVITLFLILLMSIFMFSGIYYTPPANMKHIKTKNFDFIFEDGLDYLVQELNEEAENLYSEYSNFYETNAGSITVYLLDDVDFVNSFADIVHNVIRLYIVPPNSNIGLGKNISNWIKFVFSHELNHIFYGNAVFNPLLKTIPFSSVKKTLNFLIYEPSYLHEGLSVFMESKHFGGRYEDTLFNTYVRSEVISNKFPRYYLNTKRDSNNFTIAGFNYTYGALITKKIKEYYSEDTLKKIIIYMNSNYFTTISTSFKAVTKDNWYDFLLKIKNEYIKDKEDKLSKGYTMLWNKTNNSYHKTSNLRTDGKYFYYIKNSPNEINGLYKENELIKNNVSKFDISNDGKIIYLDTSNEYGKYLNKLYLKCTCPIKDTLIDTRVIEFGFVDNSKIVYSKTEKGLIGLFEYDLKNNSIKKIIEYGKYSINSITGNNGKIYFSMSRNNQTDIYVYDGKLIQITNDKYNEINLFLYNDELFYSADYDGIYNIRSLNLKTNKIKTYTKYYTGGFNPVIINNKLYHLFYDYNGYHLTFKNLEETKEEKTIEILNKAIETKQKFDFTKIKDKKDYIDMPTDLFGFPYVLNTPNSTDSYYYGLFLMFNNKSRNITGTFDINSLQTTTLSFNFDYYINHNISIKLTDFLNKPTFYFDYGISNTFDINLKNKMYIQPVLNVEFKNIDLNSVYFNTAFINNPYTINDFQMYDFGMNLSLNSNLLNNTLEYKMILNKPFFIFNSKITPRIVYEGLYTASLSVGTTFEIPLIDLNLYFNDGKTGINNLNLTVDNSYDFTNKKYSISLLITIGERMFYQDIPISIPIYKYNKSF
ncbi:hypothetical protein OSSY52_13860 [Tepiditoga spiralis]|uniref:Peptidase MA-like domain-containing protein n=1 Tax=Tepiditoga spiralis TaxID=2108365 RepID=A0A7G1G558_9BACT|nr:hypothetical protein [Tepiditoga spiralis]BBE31245.1 hypothetical protein OSSY52_13860 [Tepiditoga spiralis]